MADYRLNIIITGKDMASGALGSVGKALGGLGAAALAGVAVAGAAVAGLGVALGKLAIDAAPLEGIGMAFDIMSEKAGLALADLQAASAGTISDFELMRSANVALTGAGEDLGQAFGRDLPQLLEISRAAARATGQDVGFLFTSLVTGIKRTSPMLIDNTGLQLKLGEANQALADSLGITVEQLTGEQRQIALLNATLEAGAAMVADFGGGQLTAAEKMAQFRASAQNTKDQIGLALLPALQALLVPLSELAETYGPQVIAWAEQAGIWLGENIPLAVTWLSETVAALLPTLQLWGERLFELAQQVLPAFATAIQFVIDHWEIFAALAAVVAVVIIALNAPLVLIAAALAALAVAWSKDWLGIRTTVENATAAIRAVIEKWLAVLAHWWRHHGDSVMTIVNFLWNNIQSITAAVTAAISALLTAATNLWQSLWSSHGSALTNLITAIWENIKAIWSAAFSVLGSILDAFAAAIEGDWRAFGAHLRRAWDTIWAAIEAALRNTGAALTALVVSIVRSIVDTFEGIDWGSVGSSIIEGIKNGITSAAGALARAAAQAAQAALDAAKGFLGIHSPSQAFALVGRQMMEGMALGIGGTSHIPALAAVGAGTQALDMSRHATYNLTANYVHQPEHRLRDDVRMMQLLAGT